MATAISDKLAAFKRMFGGAADEILDAANQVEKEADTAKVEFKEADTPEALKAKKPAPEKVEVELEVEETEADEEAEEEVEEEEVEGKETSLDDLPQVDENGDFDGAMGLMDVKEYGLLMADVLEAGLLAPLAEEIKAMKEAIVLEFRETVAAHKERNDEGMRLAADAAVDHETRIQALETALKQSEKENKALKAAFKELSGDMPRGFTRNGYIASEAEDTIIPEGDSRLKEGPSADPLATFADQFVLAGIK